MSARDQNICRTCLRNGDADDGFNLLEIYQNGVAIVLDNIPLPQMMNECTNKEIIYSDPYPKKICTKCIEDLKIAYNFRKQVENAYSMIKSFFNVYDDEDKEDDDGIDDDIDSKFPPLPKTKILISEEEKPTEKCTQTDDLSFYPCEKCDMKFVNYELLMEHKQDHKGTLNKCRVCSKVFSRVSHLKRHIAVFHPELGIKPTLVCEFCRKAFTRHDKLRGHLRRYHVKQEKTDAENKSETEKPEEVEKLLCALCNETFYTASSYKQHYCKERRNHERVKPIIKPMPSTLAEPEISLIEITSNEIFEDNKDDLEAYKNNTEDCNITNNDESLNSDEEDIKPLIHIKEQSENEHNFDIPLQNPLSIKFDHDSLETTELETDTFKVPNDENVPKIKETKTNKAKHCCDKCDKHFVRATSLRRHLITHSGKRPYVCEVCSKSFTRLDYLKEHRCDDIKPQEKSNSEPKSKTELSEKSYSESKQKTSPSSSTKTSDKPPIVCEQCNKTFTRPTHLRRHLMLHTGERPYVCEVCNKSFTRIDRLKAHTLIHSEIKPYSCDQCIRTFTHPEILRKHKELRHSTSPPEIARNEHCTLCEKSFSSTRYLQIHMKSHRPRRWTCKHCSEVFDSKADYNTHVKTHPNIKPFLCSECGLSFVRNDYLIIHMRRHKGEKPYKCKYCEKGFPRATDLTVHERYHTGEKTHLCTTCGKGFHRAYNLVVHMRVHTGERPYQCPHCSKSFAQGNDLKAHIRRHTGERFKCDICDCGFIQGYHLTQHKRTVHGIDVKSHIRRLEKFIAPAKQQQNEVSQRRKLKDSTITSNSTIEPFPVQIMVPQPVLDCNTDPMHMVKIEKNITDDI